MTTNTTQTPAQKIIAECNEVLERHEGLYAFSTGGRIVCAWCADDDGDYVDHPCDAVVMARRLRLAVEALEELADYPSELAKFTFAAMVGDDGE